jgi:hypothetical protein
MFLRQPPVHGVVIGILCIVSVRMSTGEKTAESYCKARGFDYASVGLSLGGGTLMPGDVSFDCHNNGEHSTPLPTSVYPHISSPDPLVCMDGGYMMACM